LSTQSLSGAAKERSCCLQASNLIRALRQSREAAALGLLEGQSQRSEGQQDIEVNVNKVAALWWSQNSGLR